MSTQNILKTPEFISEDKSYDSYEKDLRRWARFTTIEKKNQAEWIVMHLEGHPSKIKDKIDTQIGEKLVECETGIDELLKFLKELYKIDDFTESFRSYMTFESISRKPDEDIKDFVNRWDNAVAKIKKND